jgi:hypothetical protein
VNAICKLYSKAIIHLEAATGEYQALNSTCDVDLLKKWRQQEESAMQHRVTDVTAMDIYDVQKKKGMRRNLYLFPC